MPAASQQRLRSAFDQLKNSAKRIKLYEHPELYDLAYPGSREDVTFYSRLASQGHVLYLGVGTGRVFGQIATVNPNLVGLDFSQAMLSTFAKRHPDLASRVCHGNVLDRLLYKPQIFDRILAPHSFLTHFTEHDLERALANCRHWLKPGGSLVTDNFSPFLNPPTAKPLELYHRRERKKLKIVTYIEYDPVRQVATEWNFYRQHARQELLVAPISLRYFYPAEFKRILLAARFQRVKLLGGFSGGAVTPGSSELIYIAKR